MKSRLKYIASIRMSLFVTKTFDVSLRKKIFPLFFLLLPFIGFGQLTGGTISATKCQFWNLRSISQIAAITGENLGEATTYYWERSQSSDMSGHIDFIGGQILNNNALSLTGTWYFRRRVENDGNIAYSNTVQIVMMPTATITGGTTVCQNASSPTLTITAVGGTAPYTITYTVNGGSTITVGTAGLTSTADIVVPTSVAGVYTYSITSIVDANSLSETCTNTSFSGSTSGATVTVNPLPTANIVADLTTVCKNGTSPIITFTGAGATAPYTITYDVTTNGSTVSNQTIVTNLSGTATLTVPTSIAGTIVYQLVSVQSSITNCINTQTASTTITINNNPTITSISPTTPTVCQGTTSFVVNFATTGSPDQYYIVWDAAAITAGFTNTGTQTFNATPGDITVSVPPGVAAGTYFGTLRLTNTSTNCYVENSAGAIINPLPVANISADITTVCLNGTSPTITINASGATAPYTVTYNITTNGVTAANQTVSTNGSGVATLSVPVSGAATITYQLVSVQSSVTNCINAQTASTTVTVNPLPTASIAVDAASVCVNGTSPTITITGAGATAPYTVTYNITTNGVTAANQTVSTNGSGVATLSVPVSSAATITYQLVSVQSSVTNCINAQTTSTTVTVNPLPTASIAVDAASVCVNGTAPTVTITGAGATAPYTVTYNITTNGVTGANQTVSTNGSGVATLSVPVSSAATITYQLVSVQSSVTNCINAQTASTTVTVNPLPTASIAVDAASVCVNGTAPTVTITGAGATAPYTVTYNITTNGVTGANQTVSTNGAGVATLTVPVSGAATISYQLVSVQSSVTNCINAQTASTTVTVNPLPTASIAVDAASVCVNGTAPTITITGTGATAPYTVTYNITTNGVTAANQTVSTNGAGVATLTVPVSSAATITYQLVSVQSSVTNCINAQTASTTVTVNPLPTASIAVDAASVCVNGTAPTVTITGSGATAPYTVTYNITTNGVTAANQTVSTNGSGVATLSVPVSSAATITYQLVSVQSSVTNCINAQTASTTVTVNPLPTASIAVDAASVCVNGTAPIVTITGSGATAPYTVTYNITTNGVTAANQTVSTNGAGVAMITVPVSSAATITYQLVSVQSSVTNCINAQTASTTVTVNPLPTASISVDAATVCVNGTAPTVTITGSGATAPYTVTYNITTNGVTAANQTVSTNGAGVATITVPVSSAATITYQLVSVQSSVTNCINAQTASTTVTVNPLPTASIAVDAASVCVNGTSPTITITGAGATAPYTVTYNITTNGVTAANQTVSTNGSGVATLSVPVSSAATITYQLVSVQSSVTNCINTQTSSVTITINALPVLSAISGNTPVCIGNTRTLTATPIGGSWTSANNTIATINNTTGVLNALSAGTSLITYTYTDGNGCTASVNANQSVNALPVVSSITNTTPICAGNTRPLTVSPTGGSWSSNNTTVATINGSGVLNALSAGNTTISYSYTDANGCTSNATPVTVTVNALPTVNTITGNAIICVGNTRTLSNSSTGGVWSSSNNAVATINNLGVVSAVSAGNTTISYTVTANGCSNTATVVTTVAPLPVLSSLNNSAICVGSNNLFTHPQSGGSWSSSNNSVATIANSGLVTTITPGTATISYAYTDNNGCSASVGAVLTVNALPNLVINNPAVVCSPAVVNLTAATITSGSTGGSTFSYWLNAAATQPITAPTAIGNSGTYYIKATLPITGCSNTKPVLVTINPQAVMVINTPTPVCAPGTIDLTAAAVTSGSAAGLTYSYYTDAAASNVLSNANAVGTSGTYYIKGMPATGCPAIVPVSITIYPLPNLVVNVPAPVCAPQVVDLTTPTITNGSDPNLRFAYFSDAATTAPITNPAAFNSSGQFYIRATDQQTGCVRVAGSQVTIYPLPNGVLNQPAITYVCEGSSLLLQASGATAYQWLLNQQPINGATAANYAATTAGTYSVQFISANGCRRTAANTITLDFLNKPQVQFTIFNACAGVSTQFNNNSQTGSSGGIDWLWDFGDGSVSNQVSPSHIYTNAGTYTVTVRANNPTCSLSTTVSQTHTVKAADPGIRYPDKESLSGIPFTVTARSIGISYLWSPATGISNPVAASPTFTVTQDTRYLVTITSGIGCVTTDTLQVKVIKGSDIFVPQGFTPNGDGQNDRLYPILVGIRQLNYFKVFNRWGNLIFQTNQSAPSSGWDGTYAGAKQGIGTYTWISEGIDIAGNVVRRTGTVLLLQ